MKNIIAKVKFGLWKIRLFPVNKCPYCGRKLKVYGFEYHNRVYICPKKNCEFNK